MLLSWLKNNSESSFLYLVILAIVTIGLNIVVGVYYIHYHQPIIALWYVVLVVFGVVLSFAYAVLASVLGKKWLATTSVLWAVYAILNASFVFMS